MKKVLLDTNAYTQFLAGNQTVLQSFVKASLIYMSIFVLGELYAGFMGGNKEKENKDILDQFLEKPSIRILDASMETSEIFGYIKNTLKKAGTPIPINDVWIAAHAAETGSVIITYDEHFKLIPGIRLWDSLL